MSWQPFCWHDNQDSNVDIMLTFWQDVVSHNLLIRHDLIIFIWMKYNDNILAIEDLAVPDTKNTWYNTYIFIDKFESK